MQSTPNPIPVNSPILLSRLHAADIAAAAADLNHQLLEEAVLTLLRRHCPAYVKLNGYALRCSLIRAYIRFILERTRGNQSRAAEIAKFNRNTIRRLIRAFAIDWRAYGAGLVQPHNTEAAHPRRHNAAK